MEKETEVLATEMVTVNKTPDVHYFIPNFPMACGIII